MRFGYACHGPCLPHRPARLASSTENLATTGLRPLRLATHTAVGFGVPSPSKYSSMSSQCGLACTSAIAASPYTLGLPLITAMFCNACMGARPISAPHCMATRISCGLLT